MNSGIFPRVIKWEEPNRRNTPPLHIATHGSRYSTLTGVCWLNEYFFVVNHRSGLRLALFDTRQDDMPLVVSEIPHLTDDIAAKRTSDITWEIAVSGCWDCAFSLFELNIETRQFNLIHTRPHKSKTFCHGVEYDGAGRLWLALHTGKRPRIEVVDEEVWRLPKPWGARDVCFDVDSQKAYAVAVNSNPKLTSYNHAQTSVWEYDVGKPKKFFSRQKWKKIFEIDNVHSDACRIYKGRIWLPDQLNDRVLAISLNDTKHMLTIEDKGFDFPHGIGVSSNGIVAVSNYGGSDVVLFDANAVAE